MVKNTSEQPRDPMYKMIHYLCPTYALGVEQAANHVATNYLSDLKLKSTLERILVLYLSESLDDRLEAHDQFQNLLSTIQDEINNKA